MCPLYYFYKVTVKHHTVGESEEPVPQTYLQVGCVEATAERIKVPVYYKEPIVILQPSYQWLTMVLARNQRVRFFS